MRQPFFVARPVVPRPPWWRPFARRSWDRKAEVMSLIVNAAANPSDELLDALFPEGVEAR